MTDTPDTVSPVVETHRPGNGVMVSLACGHSFYACLGDIQVGDLMSEPFYDSDINGHITASIGRVFWIPKGELGRWHGLQYV